MIEKGCGNCLYGFRGQSFSLCVKCSDTAFSTGEDHGCWQPSEIYTAYLAEKERAENILQALISTIKHTTCTETRDVLRCELEKLKGGGDND